MHFPSRFLIPLCAAGLCALPAGAQNAQPAAKSQPTARELFYSAGPEPDHTAHQPSKGTGTKGTGAKGTGSTSASNPKATGKTDSGGAGSGSHGSHETAGGAKIINASAGPPIGVTYTLQRLVGSQMVDVSPESVFHKDDRIDFLVQTNYAGYLYIGNKGPSGAWTPLFPSPQIENGNNQVEAFHRYTMPPGYRIFFDAQTGVEEVFILFSREPVADFEKLLYTDRGGVQPAANSGQKSAAKPLVTAKVEFSESTVDRLRSAFSRDLLIEKIDDDKPGDHKEKAVYIVNPTGASDSHVWADIRLVHK